MKKKILITGGSGLLGLNWAIICRDQYDVILGLHNVFVNLQDVESVYLNFDNVTKLHGEIKNIKPDIIIHCAGLTSVEKNQELPQLANEVNVKIAKNVAKICEVYSIKLVHISTDHLFSGKNSFCNEEMEPSPLNVYGQTKALAEGEVLKELSSALIVRTNFFGWGSSVKKSLSDWILEGLYSQKPLILFDDVYFTPILIQRLVQATMELVRQSKEGIYNIVSAERLSKYDFGMMLSDVFNLSNKCIQKGNIIEAGFDVVRPNDMSLDNSKLIQAIGYSIDPIQDQLEILKQQEISGLASELKEAISL